MLALLLETKYNLVQEQWMIIKINKGIMKVYIQFKLKREKNG